MKSSRNKIVIASDHAGFKLKEYIIKSMFSYNIVDLGTDSEEPVDYPDYSRMLCRYLIEHNDANGILICGSGIGMSIAANRFPHIRAALCHSIDYARLSREHNNANVLVLGSRFISDIDAISIVKEFLGSDFLYGKYKGRLNKISYNE